VKPGVLEGDGAAPTFRHRLLISTGDRYQLMTVSKDTFVNSLSAVTKFAEF
jgi:hypothetical protein